MMNNHASGGMPRSNSIMARAMKRITAICERRASANGIPPMAPTRNDETVNKSVMVTPCATTAKASMSALQNSAEELPRSVHGGGCEDVGGIAFLQDGA